MFPNPFSTCEVNWMEHERMVAAASERWRLMNSAEAARTSRPVVGTILQFLGATFDRIATLLPDSRDGLRTKEHELATLGLSWDSNPTDDEKLAHQIEAARLRRLAGYPATPIAEPSLSQKAPRAPKAGTALAQA